MKKFIMPVILLCLLCGQAWGATYNIGTGQTYTTFAALHTAVTVEAGDIVDGDGGTFYERIVPNGPATYRNFTADGSVSFDGGCTFVPAGNYACAGEYSREWEQVSGEFYKKNSDNSAFLMIEDGTILTPRVTTNEEDVTTNLQRGEFSFNGIYIYYRASDGASPATHTIRVARRDLDASLGIMYVGAIDGIILSNITVQHWAPNSASPSGLFFNGSTNVTASNVTVRFNEHGVKIDTVTNLDFNGIVDHNYAGGVIIQGDTQGVSLTGSYTYNGREKFYQNTTYDYFGDCDGIGIGGNGGTLTGLSINGATISNNGPPAGDQITGDERGAGIYLGTTESMTAELSVIRCKIFGNHTQAVYLGMGQWIGGNFAYNLIYSNLNFTSTNDQNAVHLNAANAGFTSAIVANNTIANNYGNAGLYLTGTNKVIRLQNNIFYNNGRATGNFEGDLWLPDADISGLTESNNLFWRSGTAWDAANVIKHSVTTWDISHIIGASAGYWQNDSSKGVADLVANPLLTSDYRLGTGSPAIDAGVAISGLHTGITIVGGDAAGNTIIYNLVDIGAYESPFLTVRGATIGGGITIK